MEKRQKVWILVAVIVIVFSVMIYNNLTKVEPQKTIIFPEEADKLIIFGANGEQYILNSTLLLEISTLNCKNSTIEKDGSMGIQNISVKVASDNRTIIAVSCEKRW